MAVEEVTTYKWTCDGCGKEFMLDRIDEEYPSGYHGKVTLIDKSGGESADWFAHTDKCISKAIKRALERNHEI